jgi:hypothetical protein
VNDEEKLQMFAEVKNSMIQIVKNVFDAMDKELADMTYTSNDIKLIKAARARLAIRSLKTMTLAHLQYLGAHKERQ